MVSIMSQQRFEMGAAKIQKAVELIEYDRLSPEQLHQMKVDAQRKVVRKIDEDKAREEGIKIGESTGEKRGKIETAKRMLEDGLPIETISKYTGLTGNEIKKL